MERRREKILKEFMSSNTSLTSKYLSQVLEVSSRTVRDDIKELNQLLSDYSTHIQSTRGVGYELIIANNEHFRQFLTNQRIESSTQLPNSSDERINYILNQLLLTEDYLKIDDLADEIHVSKSTLQYDLKTMRSILKRYSLDIKSLPNYGMKIVGEELNRRFAISEYTFNRTERSPDSLWLDQLSTIIHSDKETLMTVWDVLISELDKYNVSLSDIAINNLFVHIAIAYKRIVNGHHIELIPQDLKDIELQNEYTVALSIVREIEKIWGVTFPSIEIAYVTIHLLGTKMINNLNLTDKHVEEIMDTQMLELTEKMLHSIDSKFNLDIKNDKELIVGLCLHLKPAINRYKYGMNIRNPMLEDIKSNYPLAFETGLVASLVLEDELSMSIDEDEVAYLALHIGAAIERKKVQNKSFRCYIVCASGVGSAQLIKYRIESEFRSKIEVVGVSEYYKINTIPFETIDFIISSVPIKEVVPVPVIEVSAILGSRDISKIDHFVHSNEQVISNYIPKEHVFINESFTQKEDVIQFLSERVSERDDLPDNYVDLVYEREAVASTAYGNLVAIPHPISPQATKTSLTICTLKKPIIWDERKVQFVCLLNVKKNSQENIQGMYETLGRIVNDPDLVQQLVASQTYEDFISAIIYGAS